MNYLNKQKLVIAVSSALILSSTASVLAGVKENKDSNNLKFTDIASDPTVGINYRRMKSPRDSIMDELRARDSVPFLDIIYAPLKPHGVPGVILFDADLDGDEDIYVTNGPGVANSLYINQLTETGSVSFVDKGMMSGLAATEQDSAGVCYGDIDNDGDQDVLVQGTVEPSILFENQGNANFTQIEFPAMPRGSTGCAMGDIDNDGLLDIVAANNYTDWNTWIPLSGFFGAFYDLEHNQVFKNMGGNKFMEISQSSGIENTVGFRDATADMHAADGNATLTWAISLVDYDLDGDVDILHADDQASLPNASQGLTDRGYVRIFQNDGQGNFTDVTIGSGLDSAGTWMGLSYGDFNCDGHMDIFGTNSGDYTPAEVETVSSRWLLGNGNGGFDDTLNTDMWMPSTFGWGTSTFDLENDGDLDIVYYGGMDAVFMVEASNSGGVLENQNCTGHFVVNKDVSSETDHQRRVVQGVAVGDLDNDGFTDIVSTSNKNTPDDFPRYPWGGPLGSPFDVSGIFSTWAADEEGNNTYIGGEYHNGTLSVEMNNGASDNNWLKVKLIGSKDLTANGAVNRSGIGAVVFVTPKDGKMTSKPISGGGGSHLSQDSLKTVFGLGEANKAMVDILWPGGVRNRYYASDINQTVVLPEIPCSYTAEWDSFQQYKQCVKKSVHDLYEASIVSKEEAMKLNESAVRAFQHHWKAIAAN